MFIISIDGPAGSGKTSLAAMIEASLASTGESVYTIHMDDLYNGWQLALSQQLTDSLETIIQGARDYATLKVPQFDWVRGVFGEPLILPAPSTLILEGVGSGQNVIRDQVSIKLWLETPRELALARTLQRDGEENHRLMARWQIDEAKHFECEASESAADYRVKSAP